MYEAYGLFIDGRWRHARDRATLPVVDPATEDEIGWKRGPSCALRGPGWSSTATLSSPLAAAVAAGKRSATATTQDP